MTTVMLAKMMRMLAKMRRMRKVKVLRTLPARQVLLRRWSVCWEWENTKRDHN